MKILYLLLVSLFMSATAFVPCTNAKNQTASIKKQIKYIKKKHPNALSSIKEFATRKSNLENSSYTVEFEQQCKAYFEIAHDYPTSDKKQKAKIKRALNRWNWLPKDDVLDSMIPIDYYMAWKEVYKK